MVGRPKAELIVSDEDRATLTRWTARRTTAQALALRSRIILRCATGVPSGGIVPQSRRDCARGLRRVGLWRWVGEPCRSAGD